MKKGIILAGGSGSRLLPLTFSVTKQLLPIHDKPMIYYPLSTLMDLGITDILLISTNEDKHLFQKLFGDGSGLGVKISYEIQAKPNGIAEGLIISEKFIDNDPFVFILGDNLFVGSIGKKQLKKSLSKKIGATIFSYKVKDPERYGVVEIDKSGNPIDIIEKPQKPNSNQAITGLYFYDSNACKIAKQLNPSSRNELEISDVNKYYLKEKLLTVIQLDKDVTWLDAGTINSLYEATNFVSALELRTGQKIGCIEEIAFTNNKIDINQLKNLIVKYGNSDYATYLKNILKEIN